MTMTPAERLSLAADNKLTNDVIVHTADEHCDIPRQEALLPVPLILASPGPRCTSGVPPTACYADRATCIWHMTRRVNERYRSAGFVPFRRADDDERDADSRTQSYNSASRTNID